MSETPDYLGNRTVEEGDKVDYGVKGMKWGVRRVKLMHDLKWDKNPKDVDKPVFPTDKREGKRGTIKNHSYQDYRTEGNDVYRKYSTGHKDVWLDGSTRPRRIVRPLSLVNAVDKATGLVDLLMSDDSPDYLANRVVEDGDKVDFGVKGMKWGIRRSPAELAKGVGSDAPSTKAPAGPETSAQRYSRIAAEAKAGRGKDLSDDDLKFFNSRTEALAKINKLNANNPGWLKKTTDEVIKKVAKTTIEQIAQNAAATYISKPINESVNKKAADSAAAKVAEASVKATKSKKK